MRTPVSVFLLLLSTACGESNPMDARELQDLSGAEIVELCREVALDYVLPTPDELCSLRGVISSADTMSCELTRDACLMSPPAGREPLGCGTLTEEDYGFCDVSVDEYTACYAAFAAQSVDVFTRADCANAGTETAPNNGDDEAIPAECSRVMARCPRAYRPE